MSNRSNNINTETETEKHSKQDNSNTTTERPRKILLKDVVVVANHLPEVTTTTGAKEKKRGK